MWTGLGRLLNVDRSRRWGAVTYTDQQSRDRGAVFQVNHSQQVGQVSFPGSRETQPETREEETNGLAEIKIALIVLQNK